MPSDAKKKQAAKKKEQAKARQTGKKPTNSKNDEKETSPVSTNGSGEGTSNGIELSAEGKLNCLLPTAPLQSNLPHYIHYQLSCYKT